MTRLTRRTVLAGLSSFAAMPARAEPAWPNRPITIVHGFPGGATDLIARVVAEGLSKRLGQQVIVEVRPGAAGTLVAGQTPALHRMATPCLRSRPGMPSRLPPTRSFHIGRSKTSR